MFMCLCTRKGRQGLGTIEKGNERFQKTIFAQKSFRKLETLCILLSPGAKSCTPSAATPVCKFNSFRIS
jgi:hypothetical protein